MPTGPATDPTLPEVHKPDRGGEGGGTPASGSRSWSRTVWMPAPTGPGWTSKTAAAAAIGCATTGAGIEAEDLPLACPVMPRARSVASMTSCRWAAWFRGGGFGQHRVYLDFDPILARASERGRLTIRTHTGHGYGGDRCPRPPPVPRSRSATSSSTPRRGASSAQRSAPSSSRSRTGSDASRSAASRSGFHSTQSPNV